MENNPAKKDLPVIALTAFLNFIGLTIAIPIFTPLCLDPAGGILPPGTDKVVRNLVLGLLLGLYPLVQFFTSPILGALSDRYGRKPVLLLSAAGNTLGYILITIAIMQSNLALAIISRIVMGGLSGSLAVIQSSLSDISTAENRTRYYGLFGAVFGFSLVIGPALGGILSDPKIIPWFDYHTPFILAGFLSLLNIPQIAFTFTETLRPENRRHASFHPLSGPENVIKAFVNKESRMLFLTVFLLAFGFNFFTQFFQVYLIDRFNTTRADLGVIFSYIGIFSILTQGLLVRPLSRKWEPSKVLTFTLAGLALVFPLLLLMPQYWMLFIVVPFIPIMNGMSLPNLTTLVSHTGSAENQGQTLGINQSVNAVAQFLPPLLGGLLVSISSTMPIWIAAVTIFLSWLAFGWCRGKVYRS